MSPAQTRPVYLTTGIGPPYFSCPICACIVDDRETHNLWHDKTRRSL